jgi:hypothetical protein
LEDYIDTIDISVRRGHVVNDIRDLNEDNSLEDESKKDLFKVEDNNDQAENISEKNDQ